MCVTFLAIPTEESKLLLDKYKLILWNNRDEDFDRETSSLAWRGGILAGRDERAEEQGTWLGIDEGGRIGNLLSITQPNQTLIKNAPSRGQLVNDFLGGKSKAADFLSTLSSKAIELNGFQMVTLEQIGGHYELYSLTNRLEITGPIHWPKGIYGFGNSPRSTPFQKVVYGERKFRELIAHFQSTVEWTETELIDAIFQLASDRTENFPDEQIRVQIGAPEGSDIHRSLCSLFVNCHPKKREGTRSTSIILVNANDEVVFHERQLLDQAKEMDDPEKWQFSSQRFQLKNNNAFND